MQVTIRLAGPVGSSVRAAFEQLDIRTESILTGHLADQAALHGVLTRVKDLGLVIVDVRVQSVGGPAEQLRR